MVLDTVVIGAGAMGSSSAYWLSKYQDVALIEQYELLHTRGSSHGQSRVIRKTYQQDYFSKMMTSAYELWDKIQQESKTSVYRQTGGLDVGREGNKSLSTTLEICEQTGLNHEVMDASEIKNRFPAYGKIDDDYFGIYQNETGILNASKAVGMFQRRAAYQGAQLIQNTPVKKIRPLDDEVIIETVKGSFHAKHVVITAGSWINILMRQLGYNLDTEVWKMTFAYYKVMNSELFGADKFPVFIHWGDVDNYGFPIHEKHGYVKIAPHANELIEKVPENDGLNSVNQDLIDDVSKFINDTFTGIDTSNKIIDTCLYTMTKNENFIIDQLPDHDNITVVGGFSGHGFKFTPLIGQIVQKMVMNEEPEYNLDQFQLKYFLK